jgi:hypothetical protein
MLNLVEGRRIRTGIKVIRDAWYLRGGRRDNVSVEYTKKEVN